MITTMIARHFPFRLLLTGMAPLKIIIASRSITHLGTCVRHTSLVPPLYPLHISYAHIRTKSQQTKPELKDTCSPLFISDGTFKTFKPTSSGQRFRRYPTRDHLWKGGPVRKLTLAKRKKGGRNNTGKITVRHRGGGHKQRIRLVDFHRTEPGPCEVQRLEYDPGRSAHIALLKNLATEKLSYIVAPQELEPGMIVESFRTATDKTEEELKRERDITQILPIRVGNCFPLRLIPVSTIIHCIGLKPNGKAQLARSAGAWAQLVKTGATGYAHIRLSSGETRQVHVDCIATIGKVSNQNHKHRILGKAGAKRRLGWRPSVRGMAMNPCDHPHGGGRGKSKGNKHPVSPWGKLAKGGKTRKTRNPMVIKPRPRR